MQERRIHFGVDIWMWSRIAEWVDRADEVIVRDSNHLKVEFLEVATNDLPHAGGKRSIERRSRASSRSG